MPRQRERDLLGPMPDAVVAHADQRRSRPLNLHLDAPRAGVERVFHQLLDDGSRPLDHLAGGDLVDELIGQYVNGHGHTSRIGPHFRTARADARDRRRLRARCRLPELRATSRVASPGRGYRARIAHRAMRVPAEDRVEVARRP
jgi:hypothetical protein